MEKCKISCFKCNKELKNFSEDGNQPLNGIEFATYGHYGSSIFDPMDGSRLVINLCDPCVRTGIEQQNVLRFKLKNIKTEQFELFKITD